INYTIDTGLPNNMISAVSEDSAGHHWIGTYGGGLAELTDSGVKIIDATDGLVDDKVYCIKFDSKGRMMVGTETGLSIYHGNFTNYSSKEIGFGKIRDILEIQSKDMYWLATYGWGVVKFKDG